VHGFLGWCNNGTTLSVCADVRKLLGHVVAAPEAKVKASNLVIYLIFCSQRGAQRCVDY